MRYCAPEQSPFGDRSFLYVNNFAQIFATGIMKSYKNRKSLSSVLTIFKQQWYHKVKINLDTKFILRFVLYEQQRRLFLFFGLT